MVARESTLTDIATITEQPSRSSNWSFENHARWFSVALLTLLAGYMWFDRAFAHLHLPGVRIFPAEPVLAAGIVLAMGSAEGRRLLRFSTPIRLLIGFGMWGFVLMLIGLPEHGLDAVQDSALWYYGLFAIVVASLVLSSDDSLNRLIPAYAVLLGIFSLVAWPRLAMNTREQAANIPDTLVPWTSHRPGNIAIHAALGFAFVVLLVGPWLAERYDRRVAAALTTFPAVMLLILYVAAGTQNRGGLVAGFVVIVGVPLVRRGFGAAIAVLSLTVLAILAILYSTGATIEMGSRDLSVRQLVDNIASVREGEDTGRFDIWSPVVDEIMTQQRFLTGLGFGEDLGDRYGFFFLQPDQAGNMLPATAREVGVNSLRNVHNSHLNVLARMGFIGLSLWVGLWAVWYYQLFKARARLRMVDSPMRAAYLGWAMLAAAAILANAFFDGTLESPQVGVWIWSIFGLGAAIAMESNMREWQRRHVGAGDIVREGGGSNPLDMSLSQLKKAAKRRRR